MNKEQTQAVLQVLLGALLAVAISAGTFFLLQPAPAVVFGPAFGAQALAGGDATNFSAIEIDANSSTVEGLDVDQTGTGDIAIFRDGGTAVWTLSDGGDVTQAGGVDLAGNMLTWDPTGGTTSQATNDNFITTTIGAATGKFSILVGNGVVGNGTPSNALTGEDFYVEGGFETDGAARFDGAGDFNSTVDIAGDLTSATGALTVADTLQVTGVADFDAGMTFGPTPLYPLGIATASQEIECGTTTVFTGSILITFSTLNTPTYALATQVTTPITTGAYLYASDPTTTTVTLTSLENDFTAGTTGVQAHYCAIGTE